MLYETVVPDGTLAGRLFPFPLPPEGPIPLDLSPPPDIVDLILADTFNFGESKLLHVSEQGLVIAHVDNGQILRAFGLGDVVFARVGTDFIELFDDGSFGPLDAAIDVSSIALAEQLLQLSFITGQPITDQELAPGLYSYLNWQLEVIDDATASKIIVRNLESTPPTLSSLEKNTPEIFHLGELFSTLLPADSDTPFQSSVGGSGLDTKTVTLVPDMDVVFPGSEVTFSLIIDEVIDINSADIELSYDPSVFDDSSIQSATGDLLNSSGVLVVPNLANAGRAIFSLAGATPLPQTADAILLTITLSVRPDAVVDFAAPETTIGFSSIQVRNQDNLEFPLNTQPGVLAIGLFGDVNRGGMINSADASDVLGHAVGFEAVPLGPCDVSGDGLCDSGDAILILQFSAQLIDSFPIGQTAGPPAKLAARESLVIPVAADFKMDGNRLPLKLTLIGTESVVGGDLVLNYDPSWGLPADVQLEDQPADALLAVNTEVPGRLTVGFAGVTPLDRDVTLSLSFSNPAERNSFDFDLKGNIFDVGGLASSFHHEGSYEINRPSSFALFDNYPNPFNPSTTIEYAVPQSGRVRISINLNGQLVKVLVDDWVDVGRHVISWDSTDSREIRVGSGVYLYRIEALDAQYSAVKRMLFVK